MKNYGVLKARAQKFARDSDSDPHSELLVDADGTKFRIAIHVRSSRGPAEQRLVEYVIVDDLKHPLIKVDGVAYTQADAQRQGAGISF